MEYDGVRKLGSGVQEAAVVGMTSTFAALNADLLRHMPERRRCAKVLRVHILLPVLPNLGFRSHKSLRKIRFDMQL